MQKKLNPKGGVVFRKNFTVSIFVLSWFLVEVSLPLSLSLKSKKKEKCPN